jgi:hypothetical protein
MPFIYGSKWDGSPTSRSAHRITSTGHNLRLIAPRPQGFVLVAPALHFWYLSLSRIVTATGTGGAVGRLALDQFAFAPAFIAVFFAALLTLEARCSRLPTACSPC